MRFRFRRMMIGWLICKLCFSCFISGNLRSTFPELKDYPKAVATQASGFASFAGIQSFGHAAGIVNRSQCTQRRQTRLNAGQPWAPTFSSARLIWQVPPRRIYERAKG